MVNYKTRRVVLATGGLLAALAAATAFLCVRPAIPAAEAAQSGTVGAAAAAAATLALDSGALFTLADRHAGDAMRIAQGSTPQDSAEGLDWDYVQLRL
ncbi:MAG: hypothetical protein ACREYA_38075 [Cupriavidus necator]|uniref:Membrane lipoprotein n=1 Tax=Cupriavidus necator TaxID=106590 RepID=A0A1K0JPF9_CUPNE|nr:hypothetical protein [Cupriavidus sp. SK-4]EYS91690.1 membrane protein [Cupriavidus sp. SK-4]SCU97862.1 conserved exported hypothetical protein [Cupriavidus necator]